VHARTVHAGEAVSHSTTRYPYTRSPAPSRPGSRPPEPVAHDPALLSVSHTVRRIGSRTHRAHILYTHSAWHIRPVAAPGFGPRRTADNTARTVRHIAASAAPSSLSATRTRCGTRHESSAYTSGAFPSPATAPHAFVAAPPSFVSDVGSLPTSRAVMFPVVACGRSPRSRLTWTRQRERRPRRRPRRLKMQERRHRCRPARPS